MTDAQLGLASSDRCPKIRSAWANSHHTKSIVDASKAKTESKRLTGIVASYRCRVSRQLSLIVNLSDQH
jgi:hypothetical protein